MRARIEGLKDDERRQLYKRAANMRRASQQKHSKPKHRQDYEALPEDDAYPGFEKRKRRHKGSLRQWAQALLEDDAVAATAAIAGAPQPAAEGLVLFASSGSCQVLLDSNEALRCLVAPDLAESQRSDLAVGDRVEICHLDDPDEPPTIVGVRPRTSVLSRPDSGPGGRFSERVIAANVDRAVVVASVRQPALRPRLLDRYLVAIESGGAEAAIAVTKVDLLAAGELDALLERLAPIRELGVPIVPCSSTRAIGIDALADLLRGGTAAFVGQSGVGKSSLLNALEPALEIATREIGPSNKGRHSTTASTLHQLADGTRIVDTPGIREFGLWRLTRAQLRGCFHEFDAHASACRYADCQHAQEPICAVRSAVARGEVSEARYESYLRLLATLPRTK